MEDSLYLLILYLCFWVFTFYFHYKRVKVFGAGSFIITTYILYAVSSCLLWNLDYPFFDPLPLSTFPFLYLYIMMLVGLWPILHYDRFSSVTFLCPTMKLLNFVSCIFIISTTIHFPEDISNMSEGILKMIVDSAAANEMYTESTESVSTAGSGVSNIAAVISNSLSQIGYLLTIYYLTLKKRNKWLMCGLIIACVMKAANGIAIGQRGGIVEPLLVLICTYFLLKEHIEKKIKKIVSITAIIIILLFSIPFALITTSRFDNTITNPLESICYYLGVQNINFNNYALDDGGIRYGDRTVPLFKRMAGFDNVPKNFYERRAKYPHLKMNDETFSTYVADFAIDYGPTLGAVLLFLLSFFVLNLTRPRGRPLGFHQLILLHFMLYMVTLGGLKLYPYADGGNLKIIVCFLCYCIFQYDYNKKLKVGYAKQ